MATEKKCNKKEVRRLKVTEVSAIKKNLSAAISACTKIINTKDKIVLIDGTDAKTQIKRLRSRLQTDNDLLSWNIDMKK